MLKFRWPQADDQRELCSEMKRSEVKSRNAQSCLCRLNIVIDSERDFTSSVTQASSRSGLEPFFFVSQAVSPLVVVVDDKRNDDRKAVWNGSCLRRPCA